MNELVSGIAVMLVLGSLAFGYSYWRKVQKAKAQWELAQRVLEGLSVANPLDSSLGHLVSIVSEVVIAPYYAFYAWDTKASHYALRFASHPYDHFEGIGPAYSGLALPKKEVYLPPTVFVDDNGTEGVSVVKDGDVPLLIVRFGKKQGVIRIGPIDQVTSLQRDQLRLVAEVAQGFLADSLYLEEERLRMELKELSDRAVTKVAGMASQALGYIDIVLQAFAGIAGARGAIFVEEDAEGGVRLHHTPALSGVADSLNADHTSFLQWLAHCKGQSDEQIYTRIDAEFYDIPVQITSFDAVSAVIVLPFDQVGILIILEDEAFQPAQWRDIGSRQVRFLEQQVRNMMQQVSVQKTFTKRYTRLLCQMADLVDNLNPYTVGYSDMMMHYALAIGKTMDLSDVELTDLALAARLSNIGLLGMDTSLILKEGRYTDFEYSYMKRHSEISASMIELVTGNKAAAQYVLCHHERMDGKGYPAGLSGENIPLPSRIIHVVQVFLAKVGGRSWRVPLSFAAALEDLQGQTDGALDKAVVDAFRQWWNVRGAQVADDAGNIGFCYEMCCVPAGICESCPALAKPQRCWEVPDNHCKLHGRECSVCFVRTEYLHRTQRRA